MLDNTLLNRTVPLSKLHQKAKHILLSAIKLSVSQEPTYASRIYNMEEQLLTVIGTKISASLRVPLKAGLPESLSVSDGRTAEPLACLHPEPQYRVEL